jgi:hypothetical protein
MQLNHQSVHDITSSKYNYLNACSLALDIYGLEILGGNELGWSSFLPNNMDREVIIPT